jgi:hypothetical protein
VVAYAMAKDRRVRYSSAAQLAEALAYYVDPASAQAYPQHATTASAFEAWRQTTIDRDDDLNPQDDRISIGIVDPGISAGPAEEVWRQRLRTRKNYLGNVLFFLALVIAGGLGYTAYYLNRPPETAPPIDEDGNSDDGQIADAEKTSGEVANTTGVDSRVKSNNGEADTVADDGKTLWASPTTGPPIPWAYLPARAEVVLALRPAELLRHPEGAKLLSALGPVGQQARAALEDAAGVPASEMEHLIVAWSHTSGDWTPTYVVKTTALIQPEMLVAKYQSATEMSHGSEKYFVAAGRAYAAPSAEQGRTVITSAADQMQEILARGRNSAPLSREMVKLLQTSDSQRLVTLLFEKDALITQAHPQFVAAGLSPLRDALTWLLDEDARAAGLSLHLAEECYIEARMVGVVDMTAGQLIETLRSRLKRLTSDVEAYLGRIDFHPYGKRVLLRFARMTEFVQDQLRLDTEGDQVVINAYLPAVAAHNLTLGAELAISQPRELEISERPVDPSPNPATVADKLKRPISFVQQLDTLENAVRAISAEIGVPIEVLGADLEPEGITRNNQFGVEARDRPASDVITAVLLKANPEGKLVYVIKPKSPGGEEMIFVTTRAAAARRGDRIPEQVKSE